MLVLGRYLVFLDCFELKIVCKPENRSKIKKIATAHRGTTTKQTEQVPWSLSCLQVHCLQVWTVFGTVFSLNWKGGFFLVPLSEWMTSDGLLNNSQTWFSSCYETQPTHRNHFDYWTLFWRLKAQTVGLTDSYLSSWNLWLWKTFLFTLYCVFSPFLTILD